MTTPFAPYIQDPVLMSKILRWMEAHHVSLKPITSRWDHGFKLVRPGDDDMGGFSTYSELEVGWDDDAIAEHRDQLVRIDDRIWLVPHDGVSWKVCSLHPESRHFQACLDGSQIEGRAKTLDEALALIIAEHHDLLPALDEPALAAMRPEDVYTIKREQDVELEFDWLWVGCGSISVYITQNADGVNVELYPRGHEDADNQLHQLGQTYLSREHAAELATEWEAEEPELESEED